MLEQKSYTFLRLLLNKYFTGKQDVLAKIMPKDEWETLAAIHVTQKDPSLVLFVPREWLSSIDSSWLKPVLEALPKPLQQAYLAAFPREVGAALGLKEVSVQAQEAPNSSLHDFLLSYLYKLWNDKEVNPKEFLSTWELSSLLKMSRKELLEIIDLLAMYDLVEEMRQIVDKRLLQAVLQHLSQSQQHYLRLLLRQKSKQKPMTLSVKELMKEGKFCQLLHKFGLQRLAIAFSGADEDFIWHILHTLDSNRANFLTSYLQKEEVAKETPAARLQVQHIIQFLKTETPP